MLCSRILVAYDGSDLGQKALEKAKLLASLNPLIEIHVVHVVALPIMKGEYMLPTEKFQEAVVQSGKNLLNEAKEALASIPNKVQTYLMEGNPATALLEHTKVYSCDLIVMGSRGLSGIKEFVLGSVSHNMAQHAPVPVFIVK